MKARVPQGYGGGGAANLQQIARQAQKIQEQMDAATAELEATEYPATAGGDAGKAVDGYKRQAPGCASPSPPAGCAPLP